MLKHKKVTFYCAIRSVTGIKHVTALQGQKLMRGKSASEHSFSGVSCNFRVFQGMFPGANKIQGLPGFVGHPDLVSPVNR